MYLRAYKSCIKPYKIKTETYSPHRLVNRWVHMSITNHLLDALRHRIDFIEEYGSYTEFKYSLLKRGLSDVQVGHMLDVYRKMLLTLNEVRYM
jgi:hypothetical protein